VNELGGECIQIYQKKIVFENRILIRSFFVVVVVVAVVVAGMKNKTVDRSPGV
jgi:hypothetical protein